MNSRATRSKQAGFTLIELILALALAAGVLTAALVGGLSVWESCKANSEAQTIGYVVTGVQRLLPGNTNSDYSASGINEIWSMDIVADALFDGRKLRLLPVVDLSAGDVPGVDLGDRNRRVDLVITTGVITEIEERPTQQQHDRDDGQGADDVFSLHRHISARRRASCGSIPAPHADACPCWLRA